MSEEEKIERLQPTDDRQQQIKMVAESLVISPKNKWSLKEAKYGK